MSTEPVSPWRLDTNDRYRETVNTIMSLSTAALLLPVFLAREFLGVNEDSPLKDVFTSTVYWSWGLLGFSIFSGVAFGFLSAKWARLAWGQPVGIVGINASEKFIERALELFFWGTVLGFASGLVLTIRFFTAYTAIP